MGQSRSLRATTATNASGRPPAPVFFHRRFPSEIRAISDSSLRTMLNAAFVHTGLKDPADGRPLHYAPHDFRRIFITDAVMNGLPPHIAQIIAGHRDINVTLGYKAVYPDEAIQSHLAFLARRRALPPPDEYAPPPTPNGRNSSATSSVARSPSAPAVARSDPPVFMNMLVCVAHCCGPTPPTAPVWSRSATTSPHASPKPNAKDGSARSKACRSASPPPKTNSPKST